MNIAIIGYGRMGHEIAAVAKERGHSISLVIDLENQEELNNSSLEKIDVAFEFSSPTSAYNNIITCLKSSTPVISGTTGWLEKWDEVSGICEKFNGGLFYASNYSIGVNVLFAINSRLAEIMNDFNEYDVTMEEVHHIHKLDAPSGTAISLANQIKEKLDRKDGWSLENNEKSKIYIHASREGEINGFHKVIYDSDIDTIAISHDAKSRKGFAIGAVLAGEYMLGKTGIHSMKQLLNI